MSTQPTIREQVERVLVLLRRSRRYWVRGVLLSVVVLGLGARYVLTQKQRYVSETLVLYRETIRASDLNGGDSPTTDARRLGFRLRELLMSRASLEPIVRELDLFHDLMERRGMVDAVEEMRSHMQFRSREGDTYYISFEAADPVIAQKVAGRLGDAIVNEASRRRSGQAQVIKEFLEAENQRSAQELREKEAAMAHFLARNPSFALPNAGATERHGDPNLQATTPKSSDAMLAALTARAARLERLVHPAAPRPPVEAAKRPLAPEDYPEVIEARRELADKLAHFTERHPDAVAARARLQQVEAAAAAKANKAASGRTKSVDDATTAEPIDEAQRATLTAELAQVRGQMDARRKLLTAAGKLADDPSQATVSLEVEYRGLQREVEQARDRQRQLDAQQFKARLAANSVEDDRNIQVSILDPAYLPAHAIGTGRRVQVLGIGLAALLLGIGAAVASALLDDRIYSAQELALLDLGPVVAIVPELPGRGRSPGLLP